MSEEIQNSMFKLTVLFRDETPKRIGVYMTWKVLISKGKTYLVDYTLYNIIW
jgi:hypothetical protein